MNSVGISFVGLIFIAALTMGTWQLRNGKIASGLLLISFGLMGLAGSARLQVVP